MSTGSAEPAANAPAAATQSGSRLVSWYYARAGDAVGPVTEAELRELLANGTLPPGTLVWCSDLADWSPASSVPGLVEVDEPEADGARLFLVYLSGPRAGDSVRLGTRTHVGRSAENELRLTNATVSHRHAVILWAGDGFDLVDLGSTNGTWVEGQRIDGPHRIAEGEELRFGTIRFRISLSAEPPKPPARAPTTCPSCSAPIGHRHRYCSSCGSSLVVGKEPTSCWRCGEALEGDVRFCGRCGATREPRRADQCPRCAMPAPVDAAFCGRCGTQL